MYEWNKIEFMALVWYTTSDDIGQILLYAIFLFFYRFNRSVPASVHARARACVCVCVCVFVYVRACARHALHCVCLCWRHLLNHATPLRDPTLIADPCICSLESPVSGPPLTYVSYFFALPLLSLTS